MNKDNEKYNPRSIENKWYTVWESEGLFDSNRKKSTKGSFTIVMPPPNVTGVLHMGHVLNNTIQDAFIRFARMNGFNACWVPGMDHASIATENKVVNTLKSQGINKQDLSREEFLNHAWDWKEKYGGIILNQLKKLGASCDWRRTKFTMDNDMSRSVIDVFIDLYNKGIIYRGARMVNWDPEAFTALSDEEVIYKETKSVLYYIKYQIVDSDKFVIVATTRPETLLGDTAICVNTNDERYLSLEGKRAVVPILNKEVPILFDEYVDKNFGTGVLKVTPAHDINDYNLAIKYNLDIINLFHDNGKMNDNGLLFKGEDRFECRKNIISLLRKANLLVKEEVYIHNIGYSERTNAVIEPKLSTQWFCKMKELAEPAIEAVLKEEIKFYPDKYKNTYLYWMNNIKDWCISRQLWWGQRIPAYYMPNGEYVVAKSIDDAFSILKERYSDLRITDLKQDEDILDTWFSSWLWPISVFDGIKYKLNNEVNYYNPIKVLVTAPDIIFFWVARMIMFGLYWNKKIPFEKVCFTGLVKDKLKRKMSKSLGNSPDPLDLFNEYGADGVRVGILLCAPAGTDIVFDEKLCIQGRNFINKLWNAYKLISSWSEDVKIEQPTYCKQAIEWLSNDVAHVQSKIISNIEQCRMSDALHEIYDLIWENFCSYFLEIIKPISGKSIDAFTLEESKKIFSNILKLSHPFIPFVTEEIWERLHCSPSRLIRSQWDTFGKIDEDLARNFNTAKVIISRIRSYRTMNKIPYKQKLELRIKTPNKLEYTDIIEKLCNLSQVIYINEPIKNSYSFVEFSKEFYIIGGDLHKELQSEIAKINDNISYYMDFIEKINHKLGNKDFIERAPKPVVLKEQKKLEDAKGQINALKNKRDLLTEKKQIVN